MGDGYDRVEVGGQGPARAPAGDAPEFVGPSRRPDGGEPEQRKALEPGRQPGFEQQEQALALGGREAASSEGSGGLRLDNFRTWVQSGLNAVDARVGLLPRPLAVDGIIGQMTRRAITAFQAKAPSIVTGLPALRPSSMVDSRTTWALEQATSSRNPEGRPSRPPEAQIAPAGAAAAEAETVDAGRGPEQESATPTVEAPTPEVEPQLRAQIDQAQPPAARNKADADRAYGELKTWTEAQYDNAGDRFTVRAQKRLETKYAALTPQRREATPKEPYFKQNFFKEYWALRCDQFAHELMRRINGAGFPNLNALRARTNQAVDDAAQRGDAGPAQVAGRDLAYRGSTLTELAAALKDAGAEAGIGVHVKLRPDEDRPYDRDVKDELHHWFVYVGGGLLSDSFAPNRSGAAADRFMVNWMNGSFHSRGRAGEPFDFSFFHTPTWADAASLDEYRGLVGDAEQALRDAEAMTATDRASTTARTRAIRGAKRQQTQAEAQAKRKKLPRPKAGLQPRVSAIYRPAQAKRGGRS